MDDEVEVSSTQDCFPNPERQLENEREELVRELERVRADNDTLRSGLTRLSAEKQEPLEEVPPQAPRRRKPKKKELDEYYEGMIEIAPNDIDVFVDHLLELSPEVAGSLLPCLPAYIIFMCIRYQDYIGDTDALHNTVDVYLKKLTDLLKRKANDIDVAVLWLANTLRLLDNLKQYSGVTCFGKENTQEQNEQRLKSDICVHVLRATLSEKASYICQTVLKRMRELVAPLAVSAILENEAVMGISRPKSSFIMDMLLELLTAYKRTLNLYGVDPQLVTNIFMQLFYYLSANALNSLMVRKDFCHWSRGMKILCNLAYLEDWARVEKVQDTWVEEMLAPLKQAAQLLQVRKYDECDVDNLIERCSKLTPTQILTLLQNRITAHVAYNDNVPEAFMQSFKRG
uniref:Dilute domain-containing protein n=1 Tax=Lygus hesperus TaxID=30085 RepID=A0A0K8SZH6_LYGHE